MNPIKINKDEILILKTDLLLHPRDVKKSAKRCYSTNRRRRGYYSE